MTTQMTLVPEYVNPPKPGSKYASIKCQGTYYSFPQDMLSSFQKGVPITVDVHQNDKGFWNIQRVYNAAPQPVASPAASPPAQPLQTQVINPAPSNGGGEAKKSEDIFVCGVVNHAIANQSYPLDATALSQLIRNARKAWKDGSLPI